MYTKPKYMKIIKNHPHNWHFRIAISTSNDLIARKVERGVPSPTERFNNIKKLSKNGIKVTHIIRPLIPGYSDVKGLVTKAKMSGAYACKIRDLLVKPVLPEFYKKRMLKLSEITGIDLYELYTKKSQEERDKILQPYYDEFIETCRKLKLYYACNKSRQIYTPSYCCCAIPPEMHKYLYFGNFTHAVEQAQRRKTDIITFKDVGKYSKECFVISFFLRNSIFGFNIEECRILRIKSLYHHFYKKQNLDFGRWKSKKTKVQKSILTKQHLIFLVLKTRRPLPTKFMPTGWGGLQMTPKTQQNVQ
jgi:hypothetical protein